MLFGLWLGKQDLHNDTFLKRAFKISVLTFVVIQIISNVSLELLSSLDAKTFDLIYAFIGTAPMPPTPIFMINGISIATAVISGSIMLSKRYCNNIILIALYRTGTLALTFYVAHVVIGIGFMEELGPKELGTYSIRFSVSYAIAFSTCCIIFALIWTKFYKTGPLEFVMRKNCHNNRSKPLQRNWARYMLRIGRKKNRYFFYVLDRL